MPADFAALIDLWPTAGACAAAICVAAGHRVEVTTVRQWKARNRIPGSAWSAVVAAAQHDGYRQVTLALLATLGAARRGDPHAPTLPEGHGGVSAEPAGVVSTVGEAA